MQDAIDSSAIDRLPVVKDKHRILIGPRGSTIQDLERQSGARLSFEGVLLRPACLGFGAGSCLRECESCGKANRDGKARRS